MKRISEGIIRYRRLIIIAALALCVASVFAVPFVKVNYNLSDYLPSDAPTARAMGAVKTEMPNLQVYLPGRGIADALEQKKALAAIPGVDSVLWLDDLADLSATPVQMLPEALAGQYYNDGPLYQLVLEKGEDSRLVPLIREKYPDALMKGPAVENAQQVNVTMGQIASIMYYVVPLCLLILVLSTRHWVEPLLFLIVIGVAILLNEGTNFVFGSISYITRACSAVLQLAVSIDYAVFLLHRFSEARDEGHDAVEAMKLAIQRSASAVASSASTTVFGFLALVLMDFGLGRDMGLVLAKGVALSYLSVMVILPAISISSVKWIDRTAHRSLMPSFRRFGRAVIRFGAPVAILLILLLPPAFIAQRQNTFLYGNSGMHAADSSLKLEQNKIEERFGEERMMLVMAPRGDRAKEARLSAALQEVPGVVGVMSYAGTVSVEIPPQVLPKEATEPFYEGGYARFILTARTQDEGEAAFRLVEDVRRAAASVYPEDSLLLSESAVNLDLKTIITGDNLKVLLAGLISVGLVLLVNFRNLTIPFILLLVIEGSIWLNMGIPYFQGETLNYVGYQIVSSVQLGATVDYGILLTQRYLEGRETMKPRDAAAWALMVSTGSILPPAMILALAGYALGFLVRENGIISEMGTIIGRGAVFSMTMVLLVLPQMLVWLDKPIQKTMLKRGKAVL